MFIKYTNLRLNQPSNDMKNLLLKVYFKGFLFFSVKITVEQMFSVTITLRIVNSALEVAAAERRRNNRLVKETPVPLLTSH